MSRQPPIIATVARATVETRESEVAVVGAMLLDPRCIGDVVDHLRAEDIADPDIRRVFAAVVAMSDDGEPVDVVSVAGRLDAAERREPGAWLDVASRVSESVSTAAGVEHHARQVAAASRIRRVVAAADAAAASLRRASIHDADDAADAAVDSLTEAATWERAAVTSGTAKDEAKAVITALHSAYEAAKTGRDPYPHAVRWGLPDLDDMTGPLPAGAMVVVAARPAMGKTIIAEMVASLAAKDNGGAVFISAEMPRSALAMRSVSREASVSMKAMTRGELADHDIARLVEGVRKVSECGARLLIDDRAAPTCGHIRRVADRWSRKNPNATLRVLVVDYLQLIATDNPRHSTYDRVSAASLGLLSIAKDLGIPVVALCQLSRKCEERADKRPVLSDLRESGQIEQDAHLVVTIYRDEVYHKDSADKGVAEFGVLKNRTGALGVVRVGFQGEFSRFVPLADATKYEQPRARGAGGRKGWPDGD